MISFKNKYTNRAGALCCGVAAAFMALSATSCGDFLEIEAQNEITLEKFWNEKADVDAVVAGCYSRLQDGDIVRRMMVWGEFRSDNVGIGDGTLISQDLNLEKVLNENIDASNSYTSWDGFYNVINRCNTVLLYAPEVAAKDPAFTQAELDATIAEVTALRDLCYFYLIRTFRDVPLMTEAIIDDDQPITVPATSFDDVLDFLINDLEGVKNKAIKKYPTTKQYYQRGRITQDAIKAMLCDMYLWKGDYQKCVQYADEIIESKKNDETNDRTGSSVLVSAADNAKRLNGYPIITDVLFNSYYGNAYAEIFGSGNSSESIFELVFMKNSGTSMLSNEAVNVFYGYGSKGSVAPSAVLTEPKTSPYTNKYDARGYENLSVSSERIVKYVNQTVRVYAADRNNEPTITYGAPFTRDLNKSNWVIYRLSDIMLMKAEALAELTQDGTDDATKTYNKPYIDEAFSLVSAINKRSLAESPMVDTLQPGSYATKEAITKLVMEERHRELMFEGKRYFDLVRLARRQGDSNELATTVSPKQSSGSGYVRNKLSKMDAIFWPYNLDELKVNPNLKQNPAFGSGENQSYTKN